MSRVRVSKLGAGVSESDLRDFLSFSGGIVDVAWEAHGGEDGSRAATVTFADAHSADTAQLLTGAMLGESQIEISRVEEGGSGQGTDVLATTLSAASTGAATAGAVATDVVAMMLAAGYKLGDTAMQQAKAFDESAKVSANIAAFDEQYQVTATAQGVTSSVSAKVDELDQRLKISETANAAAAATVAKATEISEHPSLKAASLAVSAGISWLNRAVESVATKATERYQAANPAPVGDAPPLEGGK